MPVVTRFCHSQGILSLSEGDPVKEVGIFLQKIAEMVKHGRLFWCARRKTRKTFLVCTAQNTKSAQRVKSVTFLNEYRFGTRREGGKKVLHSSIFPIEDYMLRGGAHVDFPFKNVIFYFIYDCIFFFFFN